MAKQNGIFKMRGSVDDLTFIQSKNGPRVYKKARSLDKNRVLTDRKYIRIKENWDEFRNAANAGKLLRDSAEEALTYCKSGSLLPRMHKIMTQIVKSDVVNPRGERSVVHGDFKPIEHFNFNDSELLQVMVLQPNAQIDRPSGKCTIDIPAFDAKEQLIAPFGATHFKIHSMACDINFQEKTAVKAYTESDGILVSNEAVPGMSILHNLPAASTNPLFLFLGIRFYDIVGTKLYPLRKTPNNAVAMMAVSTP